MTQLIPRTIFEYINPFALLFAFYPISRIFLTITIVHIAISMSFIVFPFSLELFTHDIIDAVQFNFIMIYRGNTH